MKESFKKALYVLAVLSFVVLATCTDPFESDEEQGSFTIRLKTGDLSAEDSGGEGGGAANGNRAVNYPPDLPGKPNPGAPKLEDLRFVVYFTQLAEDLARNAVSKSITAERTSSFKGRIETGEYLVTMDVYVIKNPGVLYARGVADRNPIKINGGYNDIMIEAWSADSAAPPVIKAKPLGGTYSLGAEAAPISVSVDAVKDGGTLSYQWYMNAVNSNSGGTPVGADSASYTPSTAAESTLYYYCVVSNNPGAGSSIITKTSLATTTAAVTVIDDNAQTPVISPEGQPAANTEIPIGGTATLSVSARVTDGGTLSYQWYSSELGINTGGVIIGGATAASYTTPAMNEDGEFYYYCVVTNTNNGAPGAKVVKTASSLAVVRVSVPADAQMPDIVSQPSSVTIAPGGTATLSVSARVTDGGTLSYQWYGGASGGNSSISGATSASYTTPTLNTEGAYYYYCVITNTNNGALGTKAAAITSSVATVRVEEIQPPPPPPPIVDAQTPFIEAQPANAGITPGARATLSISASVTDGGILSCQWYSNTAASNSGGAAISGAVTASYTTPTLNEVGSYYYYCVITNTNNAATGAKVATRGSNVATVTVAVSPPPPADAQTPTISSSGQPAADTALASGGQATLTVSASVSDGGTLTYQWYSNAQSSNAGGTLISGATAASYTTPVQADGTYYYYCVIKNTNNGAAGAKTSTKGSNVAKVTVGASAPATNAQTPIISPAGQPAPTTNLTTGQTATLTVSASVTDGGILSYQWYSHTTASNSGGSIITGATAASYTTPALTNGIYHYYCVITNTNTAASGTKIETIASNVATVNVTTNVTVNAVTPVIGTQPAGGSFVQNYTIPVTLTVSATVSDTGSLSYQWYSRATTGNSGGTLITSATSASYVAPVATVGTTYYYCVVTNTISDNGDGGNKTAELASNAAMVLIKNAAQSPVISVQPSSQTISAGATATLSITASVSDDGTLSYEWYSTPLSSASGGTLVGTNSSSYTTAVMNTVGTYNYYCMVKNSDGVSSASISSDLVTITVNAPSSTPAQKPSITLQPKDAYYYLPDSPAVAALTVTATSGDGGALTYQWYSGNTHGAAGTSIGGATSSSYTPLASAGDTKFYYCVVTNTLSGNTSTTKSGEVVIIMDNAAAYTGPAGTGTSTDPLIVHDVTTLERVGKGTGAWTGNWALSASYKQVKHISLSPASAGSSNWTAIGSSSSGFSGSYDGGAYTISNLTINKTSVDYQGLFGYIDGTNAIVKNFGLVNCDIKGKDYVGGVVGYNNTLVKNCYATGNVSGSEYVAGVVGFNYENGTVENCYATGNVSGGGDVGGVVGRNFGGTVENCYATGNVSGSGDDVGGVVGFNYDNGTVENCYAIGNVSGGGNVGGVVGYNYNGTVKNCYATGNVSGSGNGSGNVGGVVGTNGSGTVANCYATGNVSGSGNGSGNVGGVVGYNFYSGTVENCYATGNVSGGGDVGGVVGDNNSSTVKYCIALNPNITTNGTTTYFGRVVLSSSGIMTNNYGRSDMKINSGVVTWTNNTANGRDGADITATEWNDASWWTGTATFDPSVWDISNGKLPTLKNMPGNPEQNPVVQPN